MLAIMLMVTIPFKHACAQVPNDERSSVDFTSEYARSFDYNGRTANKLIGNVIFQLHEKNVVITCDSAYMYTSDSLDLFGRVEMFQGPATIRCDKMTYDGTWAKVRGNVVRMNKEKMTLLTQHFDYNVDKETGFYFNSGTVDRDGETLESDKGYYYSKPDVFMFSGNVGLKNKDYTIACDSMHYDMKTENVTFHGFTKVWYGDSFISANYGWQHKADDEVHFSNNVYGCTPDKELWADSLFYKQKEERGRLYGNIQLLDTVQTSILFGDEAHFTRNPEYAEVTKNPVIAYYGQEDGKQKKKQQPTDSLTVEQKFELSDSVAQKPQTDTLFLAADIIKSTGYPNPKFKQPDSLNVKQQNDSLYRIMEAYPNVRVFRRDIQAVCDSLVANTLDSIAMMYKSPVLWSDSTQISSDSIRFTAINRVLRYADFYSNAFIAIEEDSIRYSQIKGRDMKAFFADNAIYKLDVYGNAQSLYYLRDEGEITNANKTESADMTVSISDNQIKRVKYINKPETKIYPIEKLPEEDKILKGFSWQESRKPKSKEELFNRTVRPSQRSEVSKYTPPEFPYTKRMKELESKSWLHNIDLKPLILQ